MADHLFYVPTIQSHTRASMPDDMEITVLGERLVMLPERALYWAGERTLFISDPELGRAAAYHKLSVVLQHTHDELARLDAVIARTGAQRVILMGELLHLRGRAPENLEVIGAWLAESAAEFLLLRPKPAESDPKKSKKKNQPEAEPEPQIPPADWPLTFLDEPAIDAPFLLTNHPISSAVGYVLTGGQRPGASITNSGKNKGALFPCFYFGLHTAFVPAFGSPSGLSPIKRQPKDRAYLAAGDRIVSA